MAISILDTQSGIKKTDFLLKIQTRILLLSSAKGCFPNEFSYSSSPHLKKKTKTLKTKRQRLLSL